jgi:hypothetical protein
VVDPGLPVAVVPASPQLGVERVRDVGVYRAHLLPTDEGDDVLIGLAAVVLLRLETEFGVGLVPLKQLLDGRVRTGVAPFVYLKPEPREHCFGLLLRVRPGTVSRRYTRSFVIGSSPA